MKKITLHFLTLTVLCLLVSCTIFEGNKEEYGILQGVEYAERNSTISKVEIRRQNSYMLAGFRATSGKVNTWVLLNAKHSPYYKQIPQVQFALTHAEFEQIRSMPEVSDTVIAVLETRIQESK